MNYEFPSHGFGGFRGFGDFGGFGLFGVFFTVIFVLFIVMFIVTIAKNVGQWNKNNNSPRLTVDAKVVSKRTNVSHSMHSDAGNNGMTHSSSSTSYYVTFQVESGDRMELHLNGSEFGLLAEGDQGKLTFQGTRYISFDRVY